MLFDQWYEQLRSQCNKRIGLDFEAEFGRERAESLFALRHSPTEAINWLIEKHNLDDLADITNPFSGMSLTIDVVGQ